MNGTETAITSKNLLDEVSQIPTLIAPLPERNGIFLYGSKVEDFSSGHPTYLVTVRADSLLSVVCVDKRMQRQIKPSRVKELKEIFLSGEFQNTIPLSAKMPLDRVVEEPLDSQGRLVALEIKSPIHLADGSHRYTAFKSLYEAWSLKDSSQLTPDQIEAFGVTIRNMEFVLAIFTSDKVGAAFIADAQQQLVRINSVAPMSKGLITVFSQPKIASLVQKHKLHSIMKNPTGEAVKGSRTILDYSILEKAQELIALSAIKSNNILSEKQQLSLLELGISVYENLAPVKEMIDLIDEYNSVLDDKATLKTIDAAIVSLKQGTFIFSAVAIESVVAMVARDYVLNKKSASIQEYVKAIDCSLFAKDDPTGQL